jgi:hypothetical protein
LVSGGFAPPPVAADDSGWGDLNDPRVLVALVESLATATADLARSGNITAALKR